MLASNMLLANEDPTKHRRHPTYPEEFRHGDYLKVVVPHEYQPETQKYIGAEAFKEDEGRFRWWITSKYPNGYPYRLLAATDENLSVFEFEI